MKPFFIKHSYFKRIISHFALAVGVSIGVAFGAHQAIADEGDSLTFAAINTEEMSIVAARWEAPLKYLGEQMGTEINFYSTTSYAAVVEAMMAGFVDFALLAPKIYIIAHEQAPHLTPINGIARAATEFLPEACSCYHSILITKKTGEFGDIDSLQDGVLALVQPASTSGSTAPRVLFPEAVGGASFEEYFGEIFYAGAHDAAAKSVLAGKADAAFVSDNAMSRAISKGVFDLDTFNVLWVSPEIPTLPIVVNSESLSAERVEKLQSVLFEMKDSEEGRAMLESLNAVALLPLTDATFDPLRKVLENK